MMFFINNWVFIKIIKLFGVFIFLELWLGKKLIEFFINFIYSMFVMFFFYECVNIVIVVFILLFFGMFNYSVSI